ncbi:hypothetical protein LINPERPRIM_LOCUS7163 [Linum perenne]
MEDVDATEFGELIQGCVVILNCNPSFKIYFVRRERNGVAHALARHSISDTHVEGLVSPIFVDDVLLELCSIKHD